MKTGPNKKVQEALRALPATEKLAQLPEVVEIHPEATEAERMAWSRAALERERHNILAGGKPSKEAGLVDLVREESQKYTKHNLRAVINATGVVIHTNLGRSPISEAAWKAVLEVARGYSTLEFDLENNKRGSRHAHLESIITELTGAEAACVVNNNAGAVMLVLSELAQGKKALISRGELIEIGGSFRIPDIMALSGVQMVEVGTTNRTHLRDYENEIDEDVALILKVHPSNYRIRGFHTSPETKDLVELGKKYQIPVYEDQGSGVLVNISDYGLPEEPTVGAAVEAGVSVVSCSGDKLLGGPQAGIISGKKEFIEHIKKNPLMRALRPDKMTLAGLEATLMATRDPKRAIKEIPTLAMLTATQEDLHERATRIATALKEHVSEENAQITVVDEVGRAGGGSLPDEDLPTSVVRIVPAHLTEKQFAFALLHNGSIPIVVRQHEDAVLIDPRTLVDEEEYKYIVFRVVEELTK